MHIDSHCLFCILCILWGRSSAADDFTSMIFNKDNKDLNFELKINL